MRALVVAAIAARTERVAALNTAASTDLTADQLIIALGTGLAAADVQAALERVATTQRQASRAHAEAEQALAKVATRQGIPDAEADAVAAAQTAVNAWVDPTPARTIVELQSAVTDSTATSASTAITDAGLTSATVTAEQLILLLATASTDTLTQAALAEAATYMATVPAAVAALRTLASAYDDAIDVTDVAAAADDLVTENATAISLTEAKAKAAAWLTQ